MADPVQQRRLPLRPSLCKGKRDCSDGGDGSRTVSFAEGCEFVHSVAVENHSGFGDDLWYPGFVVECDQCENPVEWGAEGSIHGAPGRSRFAQYQVLCNSCQANRLYAEFGVWIIVSLASGRGCKEAMDSLQSVLASLKQMERCSMVDQLIALLGESALAPGVRNVVLEKATGNLGVLQQALGKLIARGQGFARARRAMARVSKSRHEKSECTSAACSSSTLRKASVEGQGHTPAIAEGGA